MAESDIEYEIKTYNIFETAGYEYYLEFLESQGITDTTNEMPMVVVNGNRISGIEQIEARFKEQVLVAEEEKKKSIDVVSDNKRSEEELFDTLDINQEEDTALYFYRLTCEDCKNVEDVVNEVEDDITILRFNSRSGQNGNRIRKLFEQYKVPEEDQVVPIIFFADTYLAGEEDINTYLQQYAMDNKGVGLVVQ